MTRTIAIDGRTRKVSVTAMAGTPGRFSVTVGDRAYEVDWHRVADGRFSLIFLGDRQTSHDVVMAPATGGRGMAVHVDGRSYQAVVDDRAPGRRGAGATGRGHPQITAPMPGRVVQVLVTAGQDVAAGQGIVVVEAMKMENELRAPWAGRVIDVAVEAGVSVEAGRVLVVLEPVEVRK